MFWHRRLHEQRRDVRIDARGEEGQRHLAAARAKLGGIIRRRDRVVVDDTDDRRVLMLQLHPVFHRPQVVPDVELARGLNPAENP